MPNCLNCGDTIPKGSVYCDNCVKINPPSTPILPSQPQESTTLLNTPSSDDMSLRLKKAMRRTELLSYAVAGLAIAILVAIIGIAFL